MDNMPYVYHFQHSMKPSDELVSRIVFGWEELLAAFPPPTQVCIVSMQVWVGAFGF